MNTKSHAQSGFLDSRALMILLLCAVTSSIVAGTLLGFFCPETQAGVSQRTLTFEERVAYQRAIEDVYWRHRIWPKERPDPKPPLDAVMSQAQLENKVEDYLHNSQALEDYRQRPLTAEQLQTEMDRMAQHTKQPDVLRELFEALGNDPFVIAECLAGPTLSKRLVTKFYASDKEPSDSLRAIAENEVLSAIEASSVSYTLPTISDGADCVDDTWTATSTANAPSPRYFPRAVWTGSEMIVWGGFDAGGEVNTGGRYTPSTDSWTATSITNAPSSRYLHTAVWTGSEMIVWGGYGFGILNTGGRYNPATDNWTATSTTNAPDARDGHTAVWTGSEMIVWGGNPFSNTGGRYNPVTDSWTATSTVNAPTGRSYHTAVWTDSEMIVWGGCSGVLGCTNLFNTGGRYNPGTDSWTATSTVNAPAARSYHTAVSTGSEMIVWGGGIFLSNTGGRYNPATDSWTATSTVNAPTGRSDHTAVWTGSEMIVWGGSLGGNNWNTGGRYNPISDNWTATSTVNAPAAREAHTAVWTGSEMIVWGGTDGNNYLDTGGRYCAQSSAPTITLSAAGRKIGGINTVRLTWSGATSSNIDVYRDGVLIVTTANDGSYIDSTGDTGRARYTYRVCEAGTSTCSNDARVRFRQ
jgi:N-acetylneuraminic acid mutarotase